MVRQILAWILLAAAAFRTLSLAGGIAALIKQPHQKHTLFLMGKINVPALVLAVFSILILLIVARSLLDYSRQWIKVYGISLAFTGLFVLAVNTLASAKPGREILNFFSLQSSVPLLGWGFILAGFFIFLAGRE